MLALALACWRWLPETLPAAQRRPLRPAAQGEEVLGDDLHPVERALGDGQRLVEAAPEPDPVKPFGRPLRDILRRRLTASGISACSLLKENSRWMCSWVSVLLK